MINQIKTIIRILRPENPLSHTIMLIVINVELDRIELLLRIEKNPNRNNLKRKLSVSLWMMWLRRAKKMLSALSA